jgi:hypothetical protein
MINYAMSPSLGQLAMTTETRQITCTRGENLPQQLRPDRNLAANT